MPRLLLMAIAASALAGCSMVPGPPGPSQQRASASISRSTAARAANAPAPRRIASRPSCHYRGFRDGAIGADPNCTPGVLNPAAVTDPGRTICRQSYLRRIDAAGTHVQSLKIAVMIRYGSPGNPVTYVLAQRVPAEDGGSPTAPKNLWPMPLEGWGGALTEAAVAHSLHVQICERKLTVTKAARLLEGDWLRGGVPDDD